MMGSYSLVLGDNVGESLRANLGIVAALLERDAVDVASLHQRRRVRGIHLR